MWLIAAEPKEENNKEESVKKLKAFRLEQSRKEKIKPYYIFNDAQMEDIIDKHPQTKEELLQISSFGNVKVEKYGGGDNRYFKRIGNELLVCHGKN